MLVFDTLVLESVIPPAAARGRGETLSEATPWIFDSFERLRLEK